MLCARVLRSFSLSLVSVCVQRVLSLYISLSLSLLQHKSSSVFVSSAVLLLLFSNFNHERKRKLTWWIYKFSPSLLTFVCIFLLLKIHNAHTPHTYTLIHAHSTHKHLLWDPLYVIIICCHIASRHIRATFILSVDSSSFRALSLSRPPCLYLSISLSLRPPPPVQRELMFYYVHKFSWVIIFLKFF